MSSEEKAELAIEKLVQMTRENMLRWQKKSPPRSITGHTNAVIKSYYSAEYEQRYLGVYDRHEAWLLEDEVCEWNDRVVVSIFDKADNELWTFPGTSHHRALFEAIRAQAAGVDDFIDQLISKSPVVNR